MTDVSDGLGARLEQALRSQTNRGALLREMEQLAQETAFSAFAHLWAPALYQRSATFFEAFLLKHLDDSHAAIIRGLLPLAEAAGHDSLFAGLYRKVIGEDAWNDELLALARSTQPDEQVLRAVQRREMTRRWFNLREEVALALYRRSPERFAGFIRQHVRRGWGRDRAFQRLRAEVKQHGDEELSWALFRELAEPGEWARSVVQLLRDNIEADIVVEELRKRHSTHLWEANTGILGTFVERYGRVVLPYIEENLDWIARSSGHALLSAAEKLGDEDLYWRIFFKAGSPAKWNEALREVLHRPLSNMALLLEVQRRTPPPQRWSWWHVDQDIALQLYRRDPEMFRPFLERFLYQPDESLFHEAERLGDEELLDFLSFWGLRQLAGLLWQAYPTPSQQRWRKPDRGIQKQVEQLGKLLTDRFDRLYAASPETYVQHAANILGRFEAFEVWSFWRNVEYNPAFSYLFYQHRDAWLKSASGIRELLESTNIYIQIIALDMLGEGGARERPTGARGAAPGSGPRAEGESAGTGFPQGQERASDQRERECRGRASASAPGRRPLPEGAGKRSGPEAGPDAAERVVENLPLLRALLLGRAKRSTKKQVLRCLEQAAHQGGAFAAQILPLLEESSYYQGKRAIDERLMVSFVRLRHAQAGLSPA